MWADILYTTKCGLVKDWQAFRSTIGDFRSDPLMQEWWKPQTKDWMLPFIFGALASLLHLCLWILKQHGYIFGRNLDAIVSDVFGSTTLWLLIIYSLLTLSQIEVIFRDIGWRLEYLCIFVDWCEFLLRTSITFMVSFGMGFSLIALLYSVITRTPSGAKALFAIVIYSALLSIPSLLVAFFSHHSRKPSHTWKQAISVLVCIGFALARACYF